MLHTGMMGVTNGMVNILDAYVVKVKHFSGLSAKWFEL